jgi:hypothetical protein
MNDDITVAMNRYADTFVIQTTPRVDELFAISNSSCTNDLCDWFQYVFSEDLSSDFDVISHYLSC